MSYNHPMQIISLDFDDDIISICDRLDWSHERRLLLLLPPDDDVLRKGLDLARLRRYADQLRLEVGLVTPDKRVARQARALGLPAFATVEEAERSRRGWWRGRRRRERVGLATVGGHRFAKWATSAKSAADPGERRPISARHWLFRYAAILLFFAAMAFLLIGFAYALPGATITLKPQVTPVRATQQIVADPALAEVDYENGAVPARRLTVTQSWQTEIETTGMVVVADAPARGQVVFVNQSQDGVDVPVGTRVSTEDGRIVFQTIAPLTVAGVISSTAETDVVAIEPGPQANVAAAAVSRVEGTLADRLTVSNPAAMSGGEVRQVAAVSEADLSRIRSQVLQFLQAVSVAEMEARLTEREFLARESLQVVEVLSEFYSHGVGEQTDKLRLKMEARLGGTAVDATQASALLFEQLAANVPAGFTLVSSSITFEKGNVLGVDEGGRVIFLMVGEGVAAVELDLSEAVTAITGQETDLAIAYLYRRLPLRDVPRVDVWPPWYGRIPYSPTRIQTELMTEQ